MPPMVNGCGAVCGTTSFEDWERGAPRSGLSPKSRSWLQDQLTRALVSQILWRIGATRVASDGDATPAR
jgi:hypothetical protein